MSDERQYLIAVNRGFRADADTQMQNLKLEMRRAGIETMGSSTLFTTEMSFENAEAYRKKYPALHIAPVVDHGFI